VPRTQQKSREKAMSRKYPVFPFNKKKFAGEKAGQENPAFFLSGHFSPFFSVHSFFPCFFARFPALYSKQLVKNIC
jgi:hypothetical protein